MEIPKDLKYAATHEWVRVEGELTSSIRATSWV